MVGAAFLSVAVLGAACADRSTGDGEEGGASSVGEAAGELDATALVARYAAPVEGQPGSVTLYDDLGAYHREITTSSPEARDYFDQGLRLQYAFNHAEAIRAYEEALRYDPWPPATTSTRRWTPRAGEGRTPQLSGRWSWPTT
jgi:hypothetical protein